MEDPPKLHLLVESNEEWRVSPYYYSYELFIICFNCLGRTSCPGDQTSAVRSFCRRRTSGDAQPNCTRSLQRYLTADAVFVLFYSLCILTLLAYNKRIQIHMLHDFRLTDSCPTSLPVPGVRKGRRRLLRKFCLLTIMKHSAVGKVRLASNL